MIDNPQDLITTLKSQHDELQADLGSVLEELKVETTVDGDKIVLFLGKFKKDLLEHLRLEKEEFYPDLLSKKDKKGEDLTSIREFVKEMDNIGKVVMDFLDRYNSLESITTSTSIFKDELNKIVGTLNARIETEEEGVFDFYLLL